MADNPSDPFFYILTFYLPVFAALLLVAELQYERILKYFEFMAGQWGKGMFMIFVALLLFDTNYPADAVISICVVLCGLFNILVTCVAPGLSTKGLNVFKRGNDSQMESESEPSENDADEHDNLLPRTFSNGPARRNLSNKPMNSRQ